MALMRNSWIGISVESGGEMLIGKNSTVGFLMSVDDPMQTKRWCSFLTESASLGLGLGGTVAQVSLVIGLNIATPQEVDSYEASPDFSLDLGLAGTSKYIRGIPDYLTFFYAFAKDWRRLLYSAGKAGELAERYGKLKTISETALKNAKGGLDAAGGAPTLLNIPVVGVGLRVGVNYKWSVTDVTDWGTVNLRK